MPRITLTDIELATLNSMQISKYSKTQPEFLILQSVESKFQIASIRSHVPKVNYTQTAASTNDLIPFLRERFIQLADEEKVTDSVIQLAIQTTLRDFPEWPEIVDPIVLDMADQFFISSLSTKEV